MNIHSSILFHWSPARDRRVLCCPFREDDASTKIYGNMTADDLAEENAMKKNKKSVDWTKMLHEHRMSCEGLAGFAEQVEAALNGGDNAVQQLAEPKGLLLRIEKEAESLHEVLYAQPMRRMLSAKRIELSREEYHLLQAGGISFPTEKQLGLSPVDDCEAYQQRIYEDDKMVAFMHPDEAPEAQENNDPPGIRTVRVRFAISPEECSLEHFRPDKKAFWAKHRPDVIVRAGPVVTELASHAKAVSRPCNPKEG